MTTKQWIHAVVGAFIGGASASVSVVIVAPETFNLQTGWKNLLMVCLVNGIVTASAYLKQFPLPQDEVKK